MQNLIQPWFVPLVDNANRPCRVLAFPQAGAGCSTFAGCAAALPPDIALCGLNLPGRQARFGEPPVTDLDRLAAELAADLSRSADRPYVLLGYCSGALVAFLVARAVAAAGGQEPLALVVAAYPAPQLARTTATLHTLPSETFWEAVVSFGGFPAVLTEQPDYREIFEPALRADHAALAGFRYHDAPRLRIPIVAIGGRHDRGLDPAELAAWADQTTAGFRLELIDADHWLLDGAGEQLMSIVERECRR
jgi:medium-chain acyl-[acyl-carrier-protein] hydrolase